MDRVQKQLACQLACLQISAFGVLDPENTKLAKKTAVGLAKELGLPSPAGMPIPAAMEMVWDQIAAERGAGGSW